MASPMSAFMSALLKDAPSDITITQDNAAMLPAAECKSAQMHSPSPDSSSHSSSSVPGLSRWDSQPIRICDQDTEQEPRRPAATGGNNPKAKCSPAPQLPQRMNSFEDNRIAPPVGRSDDDIDRTNHDDRRRNGRLADVMVLPPRQPMRQTSRDSFPSKTLASVSGSSKMPQPSTGSKLPSSSSIDALLANLERLSKCNSEDEEDDDCTSIETSSSSEVSSIASMVESLKPSSASISNQSPMSCSSVYSSNTLDLTSIKLQSDRFLRSAPDATVEKNSPAVNNCYDQLSALVSRKEDTSDPSSASGKVSASLKSLLKDDRSFVGLGGSDNRVQRSPKTDLYEAPPVAVVRIGSFTTNNTVAL